MRMQRPSRREILKAALGITAGTLLLPESLRLAVFAQPDRQLFLAPDDHTDYYWSADGETYRQAFLDMLDYYLDLADKTSHNRPEHQSRWNCDGYYWVWTYEQNRTPAQFDRLIERIRDGHISMPLNALCLCLGGAPAEAVLRGMYYPGVLERRFGLRFPLVYAMENQTLSYGLGALWAGAGARYTWKGICGCATRVSSGARPHEIYWWEGQDGSRLLMKWYSFESGQSLGGYAEAYDPEQAVERLNDKIGTPSYPYHIAGAFGQGWDNLATLNDDIVATAQAETGAGQMVVVSNETDFFDEFAAKYGADLPSFSASFGNEWDIYCASMAEVSASVKRSVEKLRTAEALATLVCLHTPAFMNRFREQRDRAWLNLGLYWEHDWCANGSVSRQVRAEWQRDLARDIDAYVTSLYGAALAVLGQQIARSGSAHRFFVFNALSWARTDFVDLDYVPVWPARIVDLTTGQEVPAQLVERDQRSFLRIWAEDVPPIGYKVYEVQPESGTVFTGGPVAFSGKLENAYYRVTLGRRGQIISLIDRTRAGRELIRAANGLMANDLGESEAGSLRIVDAGPVSATLEATSPDPVAHVTRITLYRDSRRIDIHNHITENFSDLLTWLFNFNLDSPDIWHEEVGAILRARYTTQGGHYYPFLSRLDWLTLNHFVDLTGTDGVGVTLSNADCYFMRLGDSTPDRLDTESARIAVLAGGQVDGPDLGIPDQGGDRSFIQRFALRAHDGYSPVEAMRFALEHQNPLVAGRVEGGNSYPETAFSLLETGHPDVLLWALKPADDSAEIGVIARFWNLADSPRSLVVTASALSIRAAHHATHWSTPSFLE